jgi:hypothetical protein
LLIISFALGSLTAAPANVSAQAIEAARPVLNPDARIADLVLVRVAGRHAVVRFGTGPLLLVESGDRLGVTRAEVVAIETGRLVLEERSESERGPQPARLVFKPGERGGTRYLARPDEAAPVNSRPVIPARKPAGR